VISKHLFVLLACLFVVMIGLGITMPVLPFYVERLALAEGVARQVSAARCETRFRLLNSLRNA
jgi:MFS transporter, DHA1 family, multidrug resistance protein